MKNTATSPAANLNSVWLVNESGLTCNPRRSRESASMLGYPSTKNQPLIYRSKVYLICLEIVFSSLIGIYERLGSRSMGNTLNGHLAAALSRLRHSILANSGHPWSDPAFANLPKAAIGVILAPDTNAQEVTALFVKRKKTIGDPWSGHMAFPGGRLKNGESLTQTARREVLEETGISLQNYEFLGNLDELPTGNASVIVSPFVFLAPRQDNVTIEQREIVDYIWIPLSFFSERRNMQKMQIETYGAMREVASFPYRSNYIVWGMTLRVVDDLLTRM